MGLSGMYRDIEVIGSKVCQGDAPKTESRCHVRAKKAGAGSGRVRLGRARFIRAASWRAASLASLPLSPRQLVNSKTRNVFPAVISLLVFSCASLTLGCASGKLLILCLSVSSVDRLKFSGGGKARPTEPEPRRSSRLRISLNSSIFQLNPDLLGK